MELKDQTPLPESLGEIDFRIILDQEITRIFKERLAEFPTINNDLENEWKNLLNDLKADPELRLIDWISVKSSEIVDSVRNEYGTLIKSKDTLETVQIHLLCLYYILLNIDFSNEAISKVNVDGGFLLNSVDDAEVNLHIKSIAYSIKFIENFIKEYIEENKTIELKVDDLKKALKTGSLTNYAN